MASQVALVEDLYSVSVDDKETIGCFLLLHDTTPESMLKAYPEVDFQNFLPNENQNNLPTKHHIHQYIKDQN